MTAGRLLALGDVHGCKTALDAVLRAGELQAGDTLVSLGDYVDRGPDSRGVLEAMIEYFELGLLIPLRGNHELMMLRARDSLGEERFWKQYGGAAALASYAPSERRGRLTDVPDRHWQFLATDCRDWYETDEYIFAHAGVEPRYALEDQIEGDLFWRGLKDRGVHRSGKTVICGHSVQASGRPADLGHTICIDTGSYCGGWLTLLDVNTRNYWQANEAGAVRIGQLVE